MLLVVGYWLLLVVIGYWLLVVIGCYWLLVIIGYWLLLVIGYWLLVVIVDYKKAGEAAQAVIELSLFHFSKGVRAIVLPFTDETQS